MIRSVVIEDEKDSLENLKRLLNKHFPYIEIAGESGTLAESVNLLEEIRPEVLFLDIELTDGNGFDLIEKTKHLDYKVIFVTAHDEYAIRAINFSALYYILKPVSKQEISNALEKLEQIKDLQSLKKQYHNLLENRNSFDKLALPSVEGITFVDKNEIIRCNAERNYTNFYLKNGEKIMVSRTLKEYDELLAASGFFRIHHSHLINLSYIKKYKRGEGGTVIMTDKSEVEVSRRRKEAFLKVLLKKPNLKN
ncbi:MAG: LytTR family DNA-binding domain-containing protein [Bacteroidales bacterium]|nr:LytTR family DNA-binding domain-containing protein [Bacteroidales bacterium]MCF8343676.1 LytTR family DNA-binding domain-containing protein [Bacteroidales bacterium]MCF8351822.1 LytTR family DNA-binding domain-containing protein [Bacteroidales bacterium]